jgi:hypothetical protein
MLPAAASPCSPGTVTITWVGRGRTNTWFDANNWLPTGGGGPRLPGPNDNVCISNQTPDITVGYGNNTATKIKSLETHEGLDISAGELDVADAGAPSQLSDLTLDGGRLGGKGHVTVTSSLAFTAGRLVGTGGTLVGGNATMSVGGAGAKFLLRDLTVAGTLSWMGGDVRTGQGIVIRNDGVVAIDHSAATGLLFNAGGVVPTFLNAGSLVKKGGTGPTTLGVPVVNAGTIDVQVGLVRMPRLTNAGSGGVRVESGAAMDVNGLVAQAGAVTLLGKSQLVAGSYLQSAGGTSLQSASGKLATTTGAFTVNGGVVSGLGTIVGPIQVNGGTIAPGLSPGILHGSATYQQAGGTLSIQIAGKTPGAGFDRLALGGGATLGGTLSIATAPGFAPALGDSFRVITAPSVSGAFGSVSGAGAGGGKFYDVRLDGAGVRLVVVEPRVSVGNVNVTEGNSGTHPANFVVSLDRRSPLTVTVDLATAAGTASAGSDFHAVSKTVTFPPGDTSAVVAVPVVGDLADESNEAFTLHVTGVNNTLVGDGSGVGTILDDDVTMPTTPPPTIPPPTTAPPTTPAPPTTLPGTTPPVTGPTTGPPSTHPVVSPTPSTKPSKTASPTPSGSSPSASPSESPSPVPTASQAGPGPPTSPGGGPSPLPGNPDRSQFVRSVDDANGVPWTAAAMTRSALLAILLLLLILFPSILFNSTYEENYHEVRGWFRRRGRAGAPPGTPSRVAALRSGPWFRPVAFLGFFAVSALLYGFLDPGFGFHRRSLALFLGLLAGLMVVTIVAELPMVMLLRRHGDRGRIRLLGGSLVVGVLCVAASRLAHFQPGYLYGVIAGAAFQRELSREEAGRGVLVSAVVLLAASIGAWLAWIPVSHAANKPGAGLGVLVLDAVLAAMFVTGLEAVVIGLLPLRFLDGHKLFAWNRALWVILFAVGVFGFVHLLLRPGGGYLNHSGNTPIFTVVGLFLAFGLASVSFWAYFRFRKPREPQAEVATEGFVKPPPAEPAG